MIIFLREFFSKSETGNIFEKLKNLKPILSCKSL